jgi:hypothetical protein
VEAQFYRFEPYLRKAVQVRGVRRGAASLHTHTHLTTRSAGLFPALALPRRRRTL